MIISITIIALIRYHCNSTWLNVISHGLLFKNFTFERIIFMNWTIQHVYDRTVRAQVHA